MLRSLQTAKFSTINGIIAAPFTPFTSDGDVDYAKIPRYADILNKSGVDGIFVCSTTGEGPSLSIDERKKLAESWMDCGTAFKYTMIQVGSSSIREAMDLAKHAQEIGANGIGCLPPFFVKSIALDGIVGFLKAVAASCSHTPLYYYHYPTMTEVNHSAWAVMTRGAGIPNLAGVKFASHDLKDACAIANHSGGRYQILGGFDELYLARLCLGIGDGGIGVLSNFVPKVVTRLKNAFDKGDLETARKEQWRLHQLTQINQTLTGGKLTCREFMEFVDLDLGPPRLPLQSLSIDQKKLMRKLLEEIGFFEWRD